MPGAKGEKKYDGDHVVDLYMRNQEGAITIPEGTNLRAATPNRAPTGKIDKTYGGASFADMKGLNRKRYENLPLFLNATAVANALPVSQSSDYELMHEPGFPVLKLCSRMVIPKKQLIRQMHEHTGGGR